MKNHTTIIAEVGLNHNGSVEIGKRLVDAAKISGADYVKFQMRDLKSLYRNPDNYYNESLATQYTLDLLHKYDLSFDELIELFNYAKKEGIEPLCTPWDTHSVSVLEAYGISAYKTASADLTNIELLECIAQTNKLMFCSTGMSTEGEIIKACRLLDKMNANYKLMHCNSTYPAPYKDIQLKYIERLRVISNKDVGYSGHEDGIHVPMAAVALGANIIEKHITLDRNQEGNDHKVSLLPEEFSEMVKGIRNIEDALGEGKKRRVTQGELINKDSLAKSMVAKKDIKYGEVINRDCIDIKSPGGGLQPIDLNEIIGKTAKRHIKAGDFFHKCDSNELELPQYFDIDRTWGLPVRFHDYDFYLKNSNPKLLEFHLSYKDLEMNPSEIFNQKYDKEITVHAPDLFENDHLIDLASKDENYRAESVRHMEKVISISKQIKPFFNCDKIRIVASIGGTTRTEWMSDSEKEEGYELLAKSLEELKDKDVEFLLQTLPPFPWYFGGQLHLNLLVLPDEIDWFCSKYNYKLCLDTSHSQLASNYYKINYIDFINKIKDHVGHMHLSDAFGLDDEGIQIGKGQIDFARLLKKINNSVSFIPEIWQGHRNLGYDFWIALRKIEEILND